MPRRNNRDKRYDPKDYDDNQREGTYATGKPRRKRKDKGDKKIYRESQ